MMCFVKAIGSATTSSGKVEVGANAFPGKARGSMEMFSAKPGGRLAMSFAKAGNRFLDVFRKLVQWLFGKGVLVELASRATAGRVRRPWQLCFLQSPNTNGHLPFGEESDASSLSAQGSEAGCL